MKGLTSKTIYAPVMAIGSGNIENILYPEGEVRLGHKHMVTTAELVGGSCINYFLRMIMAGFDAFPIPLIGKDDEGIQIQTRLIQIAQGINSNDEIMNFIASSDFLIPGIQTAKATIIVFNGRRTIFSQMHSESDIARDHIMERFNTLKMLHGEKASLIIGHMPLDRQPHRDGFVTRRILAGTPPGWLTLVNPGSSQYQWGLDHWLEELQVADIVQFNLFEIKKFFGNSGLPNSLCQIIDNLFKTSVNAIITLNRFGAIGIYNGSKSHVVIAEPVPIQNIVDPTGAGDAFASGVICALNGKKFFSLNEFVEAIKAGRLWASYACTTVGASGDCPNAAQISDFDAQYACGEDTISIFDPTDYHYYSKRIESVVL